MDWYDIFTESTSFSLCIKPFKRDFRKNGMLGEKKILALSTLKFCSYSQKLNFYSFRSAADDTCRIRINYIREMRHKVSKLSRFVRKIATQELTTLLWIWYLVSSRIHITERCPIFKLLKSQDNKYVSLIFSIIILDEFFIDNTSAKIKKFLNFRSFMPYFHSLLLFLIWLTIHIKWWICTLIILSCRILFEVKNFLEIGIWWVWFN